MLRRLMTLAFFALVALMAVVAAVGANAQPRVTEATGDRLSRAFVHPHPAAWNASEGRRRPCLRERAAGA